MKNDYEIRGDITAIFINSRKHGRKETLISTNKLEIVKRFPGSWIVVKNGSGLYVNGNTKKINGKSVTPLHRWILDTPSGMVIDHVDHDGLNNTDENIRILTIGENVQNRRGATINSKTGIRGVSLNKQNNKWRAQVILRGTAVYVEDFENINQAEEAVINARTKYMNYSQEV